MHAFFLGGKPVGNAESRGIIVTVPNLLRVSHVLQNLQNELSLSAGTAAGATNQRAGADEERSRASEGRCHTHLWSIAAFRARFRSNDPEYMSLWPSIRHAKELGIMIQSYGISCSIYCLIYSHEHIDCCPFMWWAFSLHRAGAGAVFFCPTAGALVEKLRSGTGTQMPHVEVILVTKPSAPIVRRLMPVLKCA